jgi:hypothetical protein
LPDEPLGGEIATKGEKKMKKYDFAKARNLIEAEKEALTEACLGMHEDWSWTGETIWENGEYTVDLANVVEIAGICGSVWATPVIKLSYKNGAERFLECYTGESSGTKSEFFQLGELSGPVQDSIAPIEK